MGLILFNLATVVGQLLTFVNVILNIFATTQRFLLKYVERIVVRNINCNMTDMLSALQLIFAIQSVNTNLTLLEREIIPEHTQQQHSPGLELAKHTSFTK